MIDILELHTLAPSQMADILALMKELDPELEVTPGMIDSVLKAPGSHLFAAVTTDDAAVVATDTAVDGVATPCTPADTDAAVASVAAPPAAASTPCTPASTAPAIASVATTTSPIILGVATLCVYESPTGRKASVEDVVVSQACRGQHIGKRLMEHIITYARTNLADVDLCLTSRPHRVAANNLYKSLGFQPKETNVYKMPIKL